jgi:manganese/iron transport system substrate-binding protein
LNISNCRIYPQQRLGFNWLVTLLLMCGLTTGCTKQPEAKSNPNQTPALTRDDKPKVIVTNTILCDLTRQIAAETVNLICLLTPGSDPHIYKLTPADRQSIEGAQLILYGGYNFEPELIKAIKATSNRVPKVAVHELAVPQPLTFSEDGKSTIDPHVWHDAKNGIAIVKIIDLNLEKFIRNHRVRRLDSIAN